MPRTAHLVHTRLNYVFPSLGQARPLEADWLARRVGLYLAYTVPSLLRQTVQDFTIWLDCRPGSEEDLAPHLEALAAAGAAAPTWPKLPASAESPAAPAVQKASWQLAPRYQSASWQPAPRRPASWQLAPRVQVTFDGGRELIAALPGEVEHFYVTRIDSDDLYAPDALEQIRRLQGEARASQFYRGYGRRSFIGVMSVACPTASRTRRL